MSKKYLYLIIIIVLIFTAISAFYLNKGTSIKPNLINPDNLADIQKGNMPWNNGLKGLDQRLHDIGMPKLAVEGNALHIHQHLDIFVNGTQAIIPENIGKNDVQGFIAPVHTHDQTGIIHIESPKVQKFYLGQFFDIWGVKFTQNCLGAYCNKGDQILKLFVNGNLYQGDPRMLELQQHQEIVLTYGTISQLPFPMISSYNFPPQD